MKKLLKLFLFLPLLAFADGNCNCCCCCNDDGGGGMEGGGEGSGDTCVQMSPEECTALKDNLNSTLNSAQLQIQDGEIRVAQKIMDILNESTPPIYEKFSLVLLTLSDIQSTNETLKAYIDNAITKIISARTQVQQNSDKWKGFFPNSSSFNGLFISNTVTHVSHNVAWRLTPGGEIYDTNVIQPLDSAKSDLTSAKSISSDVGSQIDTAVSQVEDAVASLQSLENSLVTVSDTAAQVFNSLDSEVQQAQTYAASINCASCSSSSGGGSGGGGSGGTIDLTPILEAINNLKLSIQEQLDNLFDLITKFYQDYKNASSSRISQEVSYSMYSGSDNWFQRMEMLLFAASGLSVDVDDEETPDSSGLSSFMDDSENNTQQSKDELEQHFNDGGKFSQLYNKITSIFSKFSYLGNSSANSSSPFLSSNIVFDNVDYGNLSIPDGLRDTVDKFLNFIRYAFQALYMVFLGFCLYLLIMWTYEEGRQIFSLAMQIYASIFGGGQ